MDYEITYFSEAVRQEIRELPDTLVARYLLLTRRMVAMGPNLGEPHTKAFGQEIRTHTTARKRNSRNQIKRG